MNEPIMPEHTETVFLEPDGAPYCMPRRNMKLREALAILAKAGRRLTHRMAGRRTWETEYVQ